MERQSLYERFQQLSWQEQLGNLASTLATLSTQSTFPEQELLTQQLLREAALMIEWAVPQVPSDFHPELAAIQKECLAWKKAFPLNSGRVLLSMHTRHQSDRVLQMTRLKVFSLSTHPDEIQAQT